MQYMLVVYLQMLGLPTILSRGLSYVYCVKLDNKNV